MRILGSEKLLCQRWDVSQSALSIERIKPPDWVTCWCWIWPVALKTTKLTLLGLEIAETSRGKGVTQRESELRMVRNTASVSVRSPDCNVRAIRTSRHWECLGRGSVTVYLFGIVIPTPFSDSFQPWKQFRTGFLVLVRPPYWSPPLMSCFSSYFFCHLVFLSGLKVTRLGCQSPLSEHTPFNDLGINLKKPHAKQTQISAVNLTSSYCSTIVFAPMGA